MKTIDVEIGPEFWRDPANWKYHRMTAQPPSRRIDDEHEAVSPASFGMKSTQVHAHDRWGFGRIPSPLRDPRHPDFARFKSTSHVLRSEAEVEACLDTVKTAFDPLIADGESAKALPHEASEVGPMRKFTIQEGVTGSWFVQRQSGGDLKGDLPPSIAVIAAHILSVYALVCPPGAEDPQQPEPADTSAGFPCYVTHPAAKLASAAIAAGDWQTMHDQALQVCQALRLPTETALACALTGRSGPAYKDTPLYRHDGQAWHAIGEWRGYAQRNRVVQMSAACVNLAIGPTYRFLHTARTKLPGLWHSGNRDMAAVLGRRYFYESDISGFDVSVTRQLQILLGWAILRVRPDLHESVTAALAAEELPLLTPPWNLVSGLIEVVSFRGGTRSGLKWTAEAGTLYALIATLHALSLQGYDVMQWPNIPGITILIQGDDVLLASDKPVDTTGWADAYASLGLKAALIAGDLFLAKHLSLAATPVPSAGRIGQQWMSGEHEPRGEPADCLGLLAIGGMARTMGSEHLPPQHQRAVWQVVSLAGWIQELDAPASSRTSLLAFRRWLASSDRVKQAIATSLERKAGMSWLRRQWREAEHSLAAAMAVNLATKLGYDARNADLGLDGLIAAATMRLNLQPWATRQSAVIKLASAALAGADAADLALQEVLATLDLAQALATFKNREAALAA